MAKRTCRRRCNYRRHAIAAGDLLAKLGRFNHDAAMTMAAVLAAVVVMAYWILKA